MKKYIQQLGRNAYVAFLTCLVAMLSVSCSDDDDDVVIGQITIAESELSKTIEWNQNEATISFMATGDWTASVDDVTSRAANTEISWLNLTVPSGEAGEVKMPFYIHTNNSENYRDAVITIQCATGEAVTINVHQNQNPDAVHYMDEADVQDLDKYYKPAEFADMNMLRNDAQWSWWRSAQSEHFVVFWEPGFGDDPSSEEVPAALRVDIDDLLAKAEQFYHTNVETLKMVETGQGKSYLDQYKMEIYLLYQTEWLATGSGYDNVIGALWVNPSTCQPVGSTIAHEIGHSFQYQVYCDKLLNGGADDYLSGFRYGYGQAGQGGNAYWEQCAQWQSFQDYPAETFGYHISVWLANQHRHYNHEWMRYASYWFPYYMTQKHGIESYGAIWQQSAYPEDPLLTYTRLYCNNDLQTMYDNYYEYATHCLAYDFDAVRQYRTTEAMNYTTAMIKDGDYFQPTYARCPGTTGFNAIPLAVPEAGTTVSASLEALEPGSLLAVGDGGNMVDGDGNQVGSTTTYNQQANTNSDYRYGYVAIVNGEAVYGDMHHGTKGTATFQVPANTQSLYLVVVATPTTYNTHPWDDDESNDEQWPYRVKFENTTLKGYVEIDPSAVPSSIALEQTFQCSADTEGYDLGSIDFSANGYLEQMAKAFVMSSAQLSSNTIQPGTADAAPAEGTIVMGLLQPDGSISYGYTANAGFYCKADGTVGSWGDDDPIWFEYDKDNFVLKYGHKPGCTVAGQTYTVKPIWVYTKAGREYTVTLTLTLQF